MTEITWNWYKRFNGTWKDPKFKAAAIIADTSRCEALSVWDAILDESSESDARGTILNVDKRVIAAGLDLTLEIVTRVWDAFVKLGMIVGERIAAWAKRQGKAAQLAAHAALRSLSQSPGAIRQRRYQRKQKAMAEHEQAPADQRAAEPELPMDLPAMTRVTQDVTASLDASSQASFRPGDIDSEKEHPPKAPPSGGRQGNLMLSIEGGNRGRGHPKNRRPTREERARENIDAGKRVLAETAMAIRMASTRSATSAR